ncbi:MAG: FAD-dependent oxidoreductase [Propioniciclava sp.]
MTSIHCDIAVIGGGLGGVAAALAAAEAGQTVVLSEPTIWLGGQLTSQAVPPDEHPWIEQFGCTARYRRLRENIRRYYRTWYPLTEAARADRALNPGQGKVSKLCHEPRVAVAVLEAMIAPWAASGRIRVLLGHRLIAAATDGDRITAVQLDGGDELVEVTAAYYLDATETGDLVALSGTEYVTGCEARADTDEPHAKTVAEPDNMQAASVCFVLEHRAGEDHTIDRPAAYDHWRAVEPPNWSGRLLSWTAPNPRTGEPMTRTLIPNPADSGPVVADQSRDPGDKDLWLFRRIAARSTFTPGFLTSDVTLVNWPMIDYLEGSVFHDTDPSIAAGHLARAKHLSLSMLYWMQTEAPRLDGGTGLPGLRLRGDLVGTDDGLAMAPYIREGRRIRAQYTICEQDLSQAVRGDRGAVRYPDSVGVGSYRIDLHPSTGGDGYLDIPNSPFEVPLRALLPRRVTNLIAAGKSLGTTHITNGCYRLHPVEWNIGEAAGLLASHCLAESCPPAAVAESPARFDDFARVLDRHGVERHWPTVTAY